MRYQEQLKMEEREGVWLAVRSERGKQRRAKGGRERVVVTEGKDWG